METVGIRCMKRVNTSVYKKGLAQLKGAAFSPFNGNKSDQDYRFPPSPLLTKSWGGAGKALMIQTETFDHRSCMAMVPSRSSGRATAGETAQ